MALLITVKGPNQGRRFSLDDNSAVIGRQPDAAVYLELPAVSRNHARITCDEGIYFSVSASRNRRVP